MSPSPAALLRRFLADYGMLGVLLVLCVCCSLGTLNRQKPAGVEAARSVAAELGPAADGPQQVVIFAQDQQYADELQAMLDAAGHRVVAKIVGKTPKMRAELESLVRGGAAIETIATTSAGKLVLDDVRREWPPLASARVVYAAPYLWPTFLTRSNLLNVANKNAVIGVIAVGMTMVIITAGIDLSVGSLVALAAVVAAWLIAGRGGAEASLGTMLMSSLAAIALCAAVGAFSGLMVTVFKVPPFIVTLAMMWVASGAAYILCQGESIADVPDSFTWLGMGSDLFGLPNTVVLMLVVFAVGHLLMARTVLGRHIYAIGGNRQAARLSGVRVNRVLLVVYTISGTLAGVGGVMLASRYGSGTANYGRMYELYAIAAVVVGGTSLAGGEGRILGTLIGVLTIAVVQNAMNLLEIGSYAQNVVLGLIVLAVVLLDTVKRQGFRGLLTPE